MLAASVHQKVISGEALVHGLTVPRPLHDATAAEAEQARAEGGACFAREDYAGAAAHYERCTVLTPREPAAWTVRHQSNRTAR